MHYRQLFPLLTVVPLIREIASIPSRSAVNQRSNITSVNRWKGPCRIGQMHRPNPMLPNLKRLPMHICIG
ncbi:hypothetical protein QR680_019036 [Steinernema hermaphroditum]|uniref:Uncharacterized protein n=1 Tax=Steinernema hermaphroditum TaxID=289476 RepID=A0AA39HJR9_9BILA|nr:hypothetical protein QR680_019036 [Steinernema hermaphroditum]